MYRLPWCLPVPPKAPWSTGGSIWSVTHSLQKKEIFTSLSVYSLGWKNRARYRSNSPTQPALQCTGLHLARLYVSSSVCGLVPLRSCWISSADHTAWPWQSRWQLAWVSASSSTQGPYKGSKSPGAESPSVHQGRHFTACRSSPAWHQCEWYGEESSSPSVYTAAT